MFILLHFGYMFIFIWSIGLMHFSFLFEENKKDSNLFFEQKNHAPLIKSKARTKIWQNLSKSCTDWELSWVRKAKELEAATQGFHLFMPKLRSYNIFALFGWVFKGILWSEMWSKITSSSDFFSSDNPFSLSHKKKKKRKIIKERILTCQDHVISVKGIKNRSHKSKNLEVKSCYPPLKHSTSKKGAFSEATNNYY